jgi:hypothetical protein
MKKLFTLFVFLLTTLHSFQVFADNKDGRILMTAYLEGRNEVPAVVTKAKGLVTISIEENRSLIINGVFDSLSGPVTNCHLHKEVSGKIGNVVLDLKTSIKGNRIYAVINNPSKELITDLMEDSIYLNVHTTANQNGEIRGQVSAQTDYHLWTIMAGAFEVPAVNTQGIGLSSIVLTSNLLKMQYKIVVTNLTGPITNAHIHYGAFGRNGGIAAPLAFTAGSNVLTGTIDVTQQILDSLVAGKLYVNIHTGINSGGEIRGQLDFVNGAIAFDGLIDGAQEVPTNASTAKGLMVGWSDYGLDSLTYAVLYTGITPSVAHLHLGPVGVNGGTFVTLEPYAIAPNAAYAKKVGISQANLIKMMKDSVYVNIHSTAFPNGEIRGQVSTSLHDGAVANLCTREETTPVPFSAASGAGYVSIDRNKEYAYLGVVTNSLSGNATLAHIHKGNKGAAGGVYINIKDPANSSNAFFGFVRVSSTGADSILNGQTYFNVHTATYGGGEIRGQIGKTLTAECLATGLYEVDGITLSTKLFPNPTYSDLNLNYNSNQSFDAQVVVSDMMGRTISTQNYKTLSGDNNIKMAVGQLSPGLYFIQLRNREKLLFTEKFLKE